MKILYFAVKNRKYPRNRSIRQHLTRVRGYAVDVVEIEAGDGYVRNALALWRAAMRVRRYDAVILAEFSLQFALIGWLAAKRAHAIFVVDWFVGLYETRVLDHGSRGRFKALAYWLCDKGALVLSDLSLTDTCVRSDTIANKFRVSPPPLVVPVGAPEWAVPSAYQDRRGREPLKILYYGNFLPLHGLPAVVQACAAARMNSDLRLTLVGDGVERRRIVEMVRGLGAENWCTFRPPVNENELCGLIYSHDVVLGTFGTSEKAAGVIANKTWQGLACGRVVITRDTPALLELKPLVGSQLVVTSDEAGRSLQNVITRLARLPKLPGAPANVHQVLQQYVADRLEAASDTIECMVGSRSHGHERGR